MTKKRIADLLKEEVEKTNEPEPAPANNVSQETQSDTEATHATNKASSTGTNRTKRKRTSNKPSATSTKQTAVDTSNTTALEQQIGELTGSLKQAQKQIAELQDDIKTHQDRIFELKDELAASQKTTSEQSEELAKVTEELKTAKETIRQITAAKQEDTPKPEEPVKKVIHGADLATNRSTLSLRNRPGGYKAIPEYAIQRGEQNSMLSDDDIGWVD